MSDEDTSFLTMLENGFLSKLLQKVPEEHHLRVMEVYTQLQSGSITQQQFVEETTNLIPNSRAQSGGGEQNGSSQGNLRRPKQETPKVPPSISLGSGQSQYYSGDGVWYRQPPTITLVPPSASTSGAGHRSGMSLTTPQSMLQTPGAPAPKPKQEVDVNKLDVEGMMDVTNYAGVDLQEEEIAMTDAIPGQSATNYRPTADQSFLTPSTLEKMVIEIARSSGMTAEPAFTLLLSQATRAYILNLLHHMRSISQHRSGADIEEFIVHERGKVSENVTLDVVPMDDVKSQLVAIENKHREDEDRLFELLGPPIVDTENDENGSTASSGLPSKDKDVEMSGSKPDAKDKDKDKDKKKPAKRISKRDLPEAVRNKNINKTAMLAVGGQLRSWMLPNAGGPGGAGAAGTGAGARSDGSALRVVSASLGGGGTGGAAGATTGLVLPGFNAPLPNSAPDGSALPGSAAGGDGADAGAGGADGSAVAMGAAAASAVAALAAAAGGGIVPDSSLPFGGSTAQRAATIQRASKRIMLKDALFCLEQQPTLRRSSLLYKWLANVK
nr:hypothetical protein HK105_003438 [Polyrhizophydium stewartii]